MGNLCDVLTDLEGQTVDLADTEGNVIGQVIVGPRIRSDAPRINARVDPDARVIGA